MTTLSALLRSALGEAETRMKIASRQDATPVVTTDPLESLFHGTELEVPDESDKTASAAAPVPTGEESATKLAEEAIRFADCLDVASNVVERLLTKEAESVPETLPASESAHLDTPASHPKPSGAGAASIAKGTESQEGVTSVLKNNDSMSINPTGPKGSGPSKTAADHRHMAMAKVAQAQTLHRLGQSVLAEKLMQEAEEHLAKIAQDPSSPQPVIKGGKYTPLSTEVSVPSGPVPDTNAGAISMTPAQARDASTREGAAHTNISPAKDPALPAHVGHTEVAKVSAMNAKLALAEIIKTAQSPDATPSDRAKAESVLSAIRSTPAGAGVLQEV